MITLRPASINDMELLRHWDQKPHIVESNPNDVWDWSAELQSKHDWLEMLIAEIDGRPIGFLQILDPARDENRYWGEIEQGHCAIDIWIGEADDLGKGYGTAMMKHGIERCFSNPDVHAILVDPLAANIQAHRFYEKNGFRFLEERTFGSDHCHVYRLNRNDFNH